MPDAIAGSRLCNAQLYGYIQIRFELEVALCIFGLALDVIRSQRISIPQAGAGLSIDDAERP